MILELKKVFMDESESVNFDYTLDLSSTDINGYYPFVSPVSVRGCVKGGAGSAVLEGEASYRFEIPCDRCTEIVTRDFRQPFTHRLVLSLNNADNDSYLEVKEYRLDLDELVRADILLELPTKFLCKEDCKGLCPHCGKNLNEGSCQCNSHQIDPRLEVLKQLID